MLFLRDLWWCNEKIIIIFQINTLVLSCGRLGLICGCAIMMEFIAAIS